MLILSNNQSNATLWILDTCVIVGLLPFMITVITASLSSKIYNELHIEKNFAFYDSSSTSRLPCLLDLVLGLVLWISLRARLLGT